MTLIKKQPEDVWETFLSEKDDLAKVSILLAHNSDYGVNIYLSISIDHRPKIVVEIDNEEVYSEVCIDKYDCEIAVRKIYEEYLTPEIMKEVLQCAVDQDAVEDTDNPDDIGAYLEEEIEQREGELTDAIHNFVFDVLSQELEDSYSNAEEVYEDLKDHFLEYMYRTWGFDIRRPMFLEDENGEEFYEEYPYECMVFEDESEEK